MDFAWECACGNVEYGQLEPEECSECGKIGQFSQLPEELIEEREKEKLDLGLEITPLKKPKALKKPGRKRK